MTRTSKKTTRKPMPNGGESATVAMLRAKLAEVTAERDTATAELKTATAERDTATTELKTATTEHTELNVHATRLQQRVTVR